MDAVGCFHPGACPPTALPTSPARIQPTPASVSALITANGLQAGAAISNSMGDVLSASKTVISADFQQSPTYQSQTIPKPAGDKPGATSINDDRTVKNHATASASDSQEGTSLLHSEPKLATVNPTEEALATNKPPALPKDTATSNPPANLASLISSAFGAVVGSVLYGTASTYDRKASPNTSKPSSVWLHPNDSNSPPSPITSVEATPIVLFSSSSMPTPVNDPRAPSVIVPTPTRQPNLPAIIISGTTYTLPPSGISLLLPRSSSPVPLPIESSNGVSSAEDEGELATTVSGTTYAKSPAGTEVYINGSPLPPDILATALVPSALVIAGQTLLPGKDISISGHVISLPATNIGNIIVDGERQSFIQMKPTGSNGAGNIVITDAQGRITASIGAATSRVEATSTSVAQNTTPASTASTVASENETIDGSANDEATGDSTSMDAVKATNGVDAGESLAVRSVELRSWTFWITVVVLSLATTG